MGRVLISISQLGSLQHISLLVVMVTGAFNAASLATPLLISFHMDGKSDVVNEESCNVMLEKSAR